MSKNAPNSGLERTERLLDLVPYLATHQGIPLEELAKEFSISTAQLTEDLYTLWMCGLPGYTALELMDLSFDTGYVSISNAETLARPRVLNRDEVLALILGLEALLGDTDPDHIHLRETISQLVSKLIAFLGDSVQRKVQAGTRTLSVQRGVIERAIASRTSVEVSYHSISRDEVSKRVIHPLEISTSNENDYVLAFCELTSSYRTFRLDRIVDANPSGAPTDASPQISASDTGEKFPIIVNIGSRLRDVVERFNLDLASETPMSGKILKVESFTADWAIREIMSFGGEVSLESPHELRKSLQERANRALGAYKGSV
jgi:proteasome accessory factor C